MAVSSVTDCISKKQTDRSVKEEIVQNACALIKQRGYYGVSIKDIARKTNISKSTVYHYFKSKNELILASIALESAALNGMLEPLKKIVSGDKQNPVKQIISEVQTYFTTRHDHLLTSLGHKAEDIAADIATALSSMLNDWCAELEIIFHKHGGLDKPTSKATTHSIVLNLFGAILLTKIYKTQKYIETACQNISIKDGASAEI